MRLIDKYILKRFLTSFVFVVLIIMAVIVIIDITEKIDDFNKFPELTVGQIIDQYYLNFIAFIANMITPLTTFIATVFVTAKMAGHTEIIAILSSGVSFKRLLFPYLIGAIIIASFSFIMIGWIIPKSNKERVQFEVEYTKRKFYYNQRNTHIQVAPNVYLYIKSYNNQTDKGNKFTLERFDGTTLVEKLSAQNLSWVDSLQKWRVKNWQHRKIDSLTETISEGIEMDTTLAIHPKEFKSNYRNFEGMTLDELNEHIETLRLRGASNVEVYEVEKYTRYSSPFAVLILTFMGVIVSARKSRGGTGLQIALGFFLSFIYILFFIMAKTLAEAGSMPPLLSIWIPNLTFMGISLIMYRYIPR
ncbi:MAG: LptF/LptG family permease [Cyclobacteriaceae bacterium]|nr:LptF/LptG family permease [Cyclobacteriaceae bacterium]